MLKPNASQWQTTPNNITCDTVQYWIGGINWGTLNKTDAQAKVANGSCFVVTESIIEKYE
jgi:hypothetical protein